MKSLKIGIIVVLLFILSIPVFLLFRLLLLPRYVYHGDKLVYESNIYVGRNYYSDNVKDNLGKPIGIAIQEGSKVKLDSLFFQDVVIEYKDDKEHNHIYVKMFMGGDCVYDKVSK